MPKSKRQGRHLQKMREHRSIDNKPTVEIISDEPQDEPQIMPLEQDKKENGNKLVTVFFVISTDI